MLPTDEQIEAAAPLIAARIAHAITTSSLLDNPPTLLVDDIHGIYVPLRFLKIYCDHVWTHEESEIFFDDFDFDDFFVPLEMAINEHTPEPYTVFWHEGALWYGDESAFFDDWSTDPDTTPADTNQEPF